MPGGARSGCGGGGLRGSARDAAAVDRRGDSTVKRIMIGLFVVAVMTGCQKKPARSDEMAGMKDTQDTAQMSGMKEMRGVPGRAAGGADTWGGPVNRTEAQRLGITFARADERPVRPFVRAVGVLKYADPNRVYVNARVGGWVEKLYTDYVGKRVTAGETLLALSSPGLVSAQEEYLLAKRLKDDTLAMSARRRLALWDIPADQIDSLDQRGTVTRTLLLRAPRSGEIVEKDVIEGQAIQAAQNLFLIADREVLCADLSVFEPGAPAVRLGTPAPIRVDAVPDRTFPGRGTVLYPQLYERTRTLTARVAVDNPGL